MTDDIKAPLVRFLKALPQKGAAAGRAAGPGSAVELAAGQTRLCVDRRVLAAAVRQGLVALKSGHVVPTAEAPAFLARAAAPKGEGHGAQHRAVEFIDATVEGIVQTVAFNRLESPLAALERLKDRDGQTYFPREAIAAGERLHADFTRGQMQPRVTMRYEPRLETSLKGQRGGGAELSDSALSARLRVSAAVEAMGPDLSGVALDVCCFMKGLETVERERQWPVRSAKLMLRTALMALHRHYQPPVRSRERHWGEADFRPSLSGN